MITKSGRALKFSAEVTKSSCSQPRQESTFLASAPTLMFFRHRRASLFTASLDLNRGVLSSRHLPVCVTKAQGMRKTPPRMGQAGNACDEGLVGLVVLSGVEEVHARVSLNGPLAVPAGPVDASEGLLVEERR